MKHKLATLLYKACYNHLKGYAPLPINIVFEATYRCNLRCVMCPYYGEKGVRPKIENELSFSEIKAIIDEISKFGPSILITGGEPFLRKDIIQIMEYIESKALEYSLVTNGTLIDKEIAHKLVKLNPCSITFSLDGPEQIHDKIRGIKGTFKKVIKAIHSIKNTSDIPININCVITPLNLNYLEEMIDIAKDLNVDLQYQHLMFTNTNIIDRQKKIMKKYFNIDYADRLIGLNDNLNIDVDILTEKIKSIKTKEISVKISFLPDISVKEIPKYYMDIDNYTHSDKCLYPWMEARINPYGFLYPCIEYSVGNLKTDSFKNIYNGQKMKYFRTVLKKEKLFPICARCCKI